MDGVREPAAVAVQRQARALDLERGAQLVEAAHRGLVEAGDVRAAVGLDDDEALARERAQRGPDGVAGGVVLGGQALLDEAVAAAELALQDGLAQRGREAVDG